MADSPRNAENPHHMAGVFISLCVGVAGAVGGVVVVTDNENPNDENRHSNGDSQNRKRGELVKTNGHQNEAGEEATEHAENARKHERAKKLLKKHDKSPKRKSDERYTNIYKV